MKDTTHVEVLKKFFAHFALRLSERYGILITFEEYVWLCNSRLFDAKMTRKAGYPPFFKGYLTINNRKVKVYKSAMAHKPLLTAIPIKK